MNEYPYYLICKKCYTNPDIKLKDNEDIIISCSKCNINVNERIENIVNYSSKYVSNAIKFCSSKHEEIIPSNIYCKTHNLFLCQDCFNNHKNEVPIGDDIIKIYFQNSSGCITEFNISKKIPVNEILKMYISNFGNPESLIDQFNFHFNEQIIDIKEQKSLEELEIMNNSTIIAMGPEIIIPSESYYFLKESFCIKNHTFIRLNKLKKNICIFHNKNLSLKCIQCNMEICDECKKDHNEHLIQKKDNKNMLLKKEYMEFENYIINNENRKR